ncbi:MAG: 50S ribosomal protein L6 [Deltaproteobacteria bacterium]|nr:50S ribosomal protein L6 [Deltaproteobacteria bacterium]
MSRIGKKPIALPKGVTVTVGNGEVTVQGPKGSLSRQLHPGVRVTVTDGSVVVELAKDEREARAAFGLVRTLISNMVQGVSEPFKKTLEISGVGYRAELKGSLLNLQVGLSHEVNHPIPKEVVCVVDKQTTVHLTSANKELVGQVAAEIRAYRPCEPYKGKGIKYSDERVRRKEGKKTA